MVGPFLVVRQDQVGFCDLGLGWYFGDFDHCAVTLACVLPVLLLALLCDHCLCLLAVRINRLVAESAGGAGSVIFSAFTAVLARKGG